MKIAIAGMTITNRFKTVLIPYRFNPFEQCGQFISRHHGIFFFINRIRFYRLSYTSAHLPEGIFLIFGISKKDFIYFELLYDIHYFFGFLKKNIGIIPIHFNQQMRLNFIGYLNIQSIYKLQNPINGISFHKFQSARNNSCSENGRNCLTSLIRFIKWNQH